MRLQMRHFAAMLVLPVAFGAARPARAVVLEQKWVAGQQLSYDVALNGTANLKTDPTAAFFLAGIPLEVQMQATGATTLDTLSVDPLGVGTITPRVEQLQVKAAVMGQNALLTVQSGHAKASINGQALDLKNMDISALANPPIAFRISPQGGVRGFVPLKTGKAAGASASSAPALPGAGDPMAIPEDKPQNGKKSGLPINIGGLAQYLANNVLMRALPSLWPDHDVKPGDKWTGEVHWPVIQKADAVDGNAPEATNPATPGADDAAGNAAADNANSPVVGKFDFTLRGEDVVAGRKAQRVSIDGGMDLTDQLNAPATGAALDKAAAKSGAARLVSAKQKANGDLWIDPDTGQIVQVKLNLNVQTRSRKPAKAGAAARAPRANTKDDSWSDFVGTFQMHLRKVSLANAAVGGAAPPSGGSAPTGGGAPPSLAEGGTVRGGLLGGTAEPPVGAIPAESR